MTTSDASCKFMEWTRTIWYEISDHFLKKVLKVFFLLIQTIDKICWYRSVLDTIPGNKSRIHANLRKNLLCTKLRVIRFIPIPTRYAHEFSYMYIGPADISIYKENH